MNIIGMELREPKFKVGETVYYAFGFDHAVVKADVVNPEVSFSHSDTDPAINYELVTEEGKTYRASESALYYTYEEAKPSIQESVNDNLIDIKERIENYNKALNKIRERLQAKDLVPSNKEYNMTTYVGHTFKVFEKDEKVFVATPINHLAYNDDNPVAPAVVEGLSGNLSGKTCHVTYQVVVDGWSQNYESPNNIFYSEEEALLHSEKDIEGRLSRMANRVKEYEELLK